MLWHPQLLAAAGKAPSWVRVEEPPQDVTGRLIAIPNVSKERLPTGYAQRAKEGGAVLLRNQSQRELLLATALEPLGGAKVDTELAADFLALGYAYLQVQLLTRQMRYASNLDETFFNEQVLTAARALVEGDVATAKERLAACFSLLAEERDRYYPVEAFLLDISMVAETTIGALLRTDLQSESPQNMLISGELLAKMATAEPASLEQLRAGVHAGRVGIIGGEESEARLPLLSLEDALATLQSGRTSYETHVGQSPVVYGRRRFGLTPALPQILRRTGYIGALHATLEDGKFPEGSQMKVSWEGSDGTSIDAVARPPLDASQPKTFLQLCTKLGESMDGDHVATIMLAHWPGQSSQFLNDLRRTAKYSACLGKFVTIEQYFRDTTVPGQLDNFSADKYKSPYLKQAVIRKHADPISSTVRYWQRRTTWDATRTMHTLTQWVTGKRGETLPDLSNDIFSRAEAGPNAEFDAKLTALQTQTAEILARAICPKPAASTGYLVINPYACVRRLGCDALMVTHLAEAQKPVYAVGEDTQRKQAVVDVPGNGFAWVPAADRAAKVNPKAQLLAEAPSTLRNEFFEAIINPITGAVQSVHVYNSRRNRYSLQLALRTPGPPGKPGDVYRDPDETATYSVMAADSIEVTCCTNACGELTVQGRLLDLNGTAVANYTEIFRVWRGSRVMQMEIELEPLAELKSDPWASYYGLRFAWGEEAVDVSRSVHQQQQETRSKNMEAPHYIEIAQADQKTTIFTGGLPFHRRVGPAMIDTLLITRGETGRKFKLGFGIDVPYPLHEATSLLAPPVTIPLIAAPPASGSSGWLLHIDSRNVITTYLESIFENEKVIGFRARLLEVAGRPAAATVTAIRAVKSAKTVDFFGSASQDCSIAEGTIKIKLSAHGWTQLEAYW